MPAKEAGFTIERACSVIMLDPRRLRRWMHRALIFKGPDLHPVRE